MTVSAVEKIGRETRETTERIEAVKSPGGAASNDESGTRTVEEAEGVTFITTELPADQTIVIPGNPIAASLARTEIGRIGKGGRGIKRRWRKRKTRRKRDVKTRKKKRRGGRETS